VDHVYCTGCHVTFRMHSTLAIAKFDTLFSFIMYSWSNWLWVSLLFPCMWHTCRCNLHCYNVYWLCVRGWLIQLLHHFISLIPRSFSCPVLISCSVTDWMAWKNISNTLVYSNFSRWHSMFKFVAAIARVTGFLSNIRIELTNHLWEKNSNCPICNILVQDLTLAVFTPLCTIQPTITFQGYPSVSKEVGTHVLSLFLPQSQFSLETLPPLDSGSWWVWLTAASWGHPREYKNWRRWRRRELSMVWPLLLIYSMDNLACLTSCNSAQTIETRSRMLLVI